MPDYVYDPQYQEEGPMTPPRSIHWFIENCAHNPDVLCSSCAQSFAAEQTAALEAEVARLRVIQPETIDVLLAPLLAVARAAQEYHHLSNCFKNYPDTYRDAWWKAGADLLDTLAHPALKKALET